MKTLRFTTLFLAVTLCLFSCKKNEPENPGNNPYIQPFGEKVLLAAAGTNEITGYRYSDTQLDFDFAEPFYVDSLRRDYTSISVPRESVKGIQDTDNLCTVTFIDNKSAALRYRNALSLSLSPETSFLDYAGESRDIEFTVLEAGRSNLSVSCESSGSGTASVDFDRNENKGCIHVSLGEEYKSSIKVILSVTDGHSTKKYTVSGSSYYFDLSAESISLSGENGESVKIDYTVDTNLPEYSLEFTPSEDAFFTVTEGAIVSLSENRTGEQRGATLTISEASGKFAPVSVTVSQETLAPARKEGYVAFDDWNFKKAVLADFDADSDGEISLDEAKAVRELNVAGKGIKSLAGLESFVNLWKLDARDNNIVNADMLKECHGLYWLDLEGNKNLESFDITGCTIYFEHLRFEVTEKLQYHMLYKQFTKEDTNDQYRYHAVGTLYSDKRTSIDYSKQDSFLLLSKHTKELETPYYIGEESYVKKAAIVLYGLSFIDVDIQDGSYERAFRDMWEMELKACPKLQEYQQYYDVYIMYHISENRNKYEVPYPNREPDGIREQLKTEWLKEDRTTEEHTTYVFDEYEPYQYLMTLGIFVSPLPHQEGILGGGESSVKNSCGRTRNYFSLDFVPTAYRDGIIALNGDLCDAHKRMSMTERFSPNSHEYNGLTGNAFIDAIK